ncbi:MAG: HIT family protein [Actinobacteria bacterium]|nr:HIT family protein [Actinomycetota bacterium]NBO80008.1 HIT family protein [Actinomycetota bacterium]NBR76060.1 HIT family protein [Actinomycetota bacterium]NBR92118.1 HIT family protein [Actinomycetota bacterium]NBT20610.1 HIT family protein [Actinomycetota bacterium]
MASLFTRIIDGELPGHFALRDDHCVVFMTIAPIRTGHALVVPREPFDHWIDMPAPLNAHLFEVARQVGVAQRKAFGTKRVGLVIAGFEVNHCHLHCIPADVMDDLNFARQEQGVGAERLANAAALLAAQLRADGVPGAL